MPAEASSRRRNALVPADTTDLPAQLESLFHVVWQCEEEWRLDDRIDLALRRDNAVARAGKPRPGR
jgi:hypothetical protein